jgi:8-oxo-dGTP pyrophosphatase MutT (NUDIX family)
VRDRPGAIAYVTRAAPTEWELLLFDVIGDPDYRAVVPGGGIEPGESAAEAAVRETLEETGLAVRVLREVGVDEGTHFFQAMPVEATDDEWVHKGAIRCYWRPLVPGLEVWGARGDLLPKLKRQRVVACITREGTNGRELLVFDDPMHPENGVQLPAGRLDPGEELESALLREIAEESGLENVRILRELPDFEPDYGSRYDNHWFHLVAEEELPDEWDHVVYGDGDDAGWTFHFRWVPIEPELHLFERPQPLIHRLLEPIKDE